MYIYIDCWLSSNVFFHGAGAYGRVYIRALCNKQRDKRTAKLATSIQFQAPSLNVNRAVQPAVKFLLIFTRGRREEQEEEEVEEGKGGWGEDLI